MIMKPQIQSVSALRRQGITATMKALLGKPFLLRVAIAALGSIVAGGVTAQTFTTLHSFKGNSDGANPYAGLVLSGNTLYGTAMHGGSSGLGTVFAVNTDGTGFTTLYSFTGGSDGVGPAGLLLSGNMLFGTTTGYGGTRFGNGAVFTVNTDGTGFTTLYSFTGGSDGANPYGLILSGNTLYGTAEFGGDLGVGTV